MQLYLGGYQLNLNFESKVPRDLLKSPFVRVRDPQVFPDSVVEVDISQEAVPEADFQEWKNRGRLVDTTTTWAMALKEGSKFPYHITPSHHTGLNDRSLHLLAAPDFRHLRLYYGDWRKRYPEWMIYPYEQTLFIHLFQFSGTAALAHASAIEIDGKGYLFLGDSGAGKSTISTLLEEELGAGKIYSDDRIVIRRSGDRWWMFGTPWHGSFARIRAEGCEIGGMFFLEKTPGHEIEVLSPALAIQRLLPVVFGTWWLPERLHEHMSFISEIATQAQFPLCRLGFRNDPTVAKFFQNFLGK